MICNNYYTNNQISFVMQLKLFENDQREKLKTTQRGSIFFVANPKYIENSVCLGLLIKLGISWTDL